MNINSFLTATKNSNASDLHLSPGNPPINRVNGELRPISSTLLHDEEIRQMLYTLMSSSQRAKFEKDLEVDFAVTINDEMRFRINAFHTRNGAAAVFRVVPLIVPSLEELHLPPSFKKIAELPSGLVLVAGPSSSGRSTTIAAMINHINEMMGRHIVTVENPVEFIHTSIKSLINHRELNSDTKSYARALKSALHEDPNVILLGGLHDVETVSMALNAAQTGQLVFASVNAYSSGSAIAQLIDLFPMDQKEMIRQMLSNTLRAVITQKLFKRAIGKTRVAAHEIMIGTNDIHQAIHKNQIEKLSALIKLGGNAGMQTMEEAVKSLLEQKLITPEEAKRPQ